MTVIPRQAFERFNIIKNRYYLLLSVSLCKFLFGFYSAVIGLLLVPIGETFDINFKTQSIIFPFNYIGQIITIFFIGFLSDKFGKKVVQIISLFILGLAALLFTNTHGNFW